MYDVYINLEFIETVDTDEEISSIIGRYSIGALYEVRYHDTRKIVEDWIPF